MSAIAGIMRFDGGAPMPRDLQCVANALYAYGPDRSDIVVAGPVGFVNMLMRMTPEDRFDIQPYRGASGALITADVRLDNREVVLEKVGILPKDVLQWPDSRVLLMAWETFGDEIWPLLRGPFAVAIWEPRQGALTIARDQLGVNVVMWYKSERFFAFATMPKGLFAFADVPRRLNEEKFADFLVLNHSDLATTIYRNIFRVLPAHILTVKLNASVQQRRYWSAEAIAPVRLSSDEDYACGLRDRLQVAVRRQSRSAHPLGCLVSGGLDSSSVAALAARVLQEKADRLSAYTQVPRQGFEAAPPRGRYADERPYVELLARSTFNIDVTYVHNDACDDFAHLEPMFLALDGPVRNPMTLGWMFTILKLARTQNRRVILSGRHGNFTISWEGWSQTAGHLRRGRLIKACRQLLLFYRTSSLSQWGAFRKLILEPLLPAKAVMWANRRSGPQRTAPWQNYSPIRPDLANSIGVESRAAAVGHDFLFRWQPDERKAAITLADFDGDWTQAIKGAIGVEVRDPTTDIDVVSYCLAVPPEQFLAEGIDRSLIRRAMWGLLPELILTNRTRGIQSADWYEKLTDRREAIASEIAVLSRSPLAQRFIHFDRLVRALADWPTEGWHTHKTAQEYRSVLARGIAAARFLAWMESLQDQRPR